MVADLGVFELRHLDVTGPAISRRRSWSVGEGDNIEAVTRGLP
jgi:hypothetical protein